MKMLEIIITAHSIHIKRQSEQHLKAEQKYYIILALIGLAALLGFFSTLLGASRI